MKALKLGFWALIFFGLVAFCVTFATQNNDLMTLNLINFTTEARPKWLFILMAAGAGAFLATLFFVIELIVLESKNIVLRRVNKKMERALQKHNPSGIAGSGQSPYASGPDLSDTDV
jgi:hypothetical protein